MPASGPTVIYRAQRRFGNAAGVIDQLNFSRARMPNFAVIHAEGPEHLAVVRNDGGRPGCAQSTLQNNASEVRPIRMRNDVRDKDGLLKVRGCATRSDIRTNAHSISRCPV